MKRVCVNVNCSEYNRPIEYTNGEKTCRSCGALTTAISRGASSGSNTGFGSGSTQSGPRTADQFFGGRHSACQDNYSFIQHRGGHDIIHGRVIDFDCERSFESPGQKTFKFFLLGRPLQLSSQTAVCTVWVEDLLVGYGSSSGQHSCPIVIYGDMRGCISIGAEIEVDCTRHGGNLVASSVYDIDRQERIRPDFQITRNMVIWSGILVAFFLSLCCAVAGFSEFSGFLDMLYQMAILFCVLVPICLILISIILIKVFRR